MVNINESSLMQRFPKYLYQNILYLPIKTTNYVYLQPFLVQNVNKLLEKLPFSPIQYYKCITLTEVKKSAFRNSVLSMYKFSPRS